jgi:hypothetical protein
VTEDTKVESPGGLVVKQFVSLPGQIKPDKAKAAPYVSKDGVVSPFGPE